MYVLCVLIDSDCHSVMTSAYIYDDSECLIYANISRVRPQTVVSINLWLMYIKLLQQKDIELLHHHNNYSCQLIHFIEFKTFRA